MAVNHNSSWKESYYFFHKGDITEDILTCKTIKQWQLPEQGHPLLTWDLTLHTSRPARRWQPATRPTASSPSTTEGKTEGRKERGKGDIQTLDPLPLSCIQIWRILSTLHQRGARACRVFPTAGRLADWLRRAGSLSLFISSLSIPLFLFFSLTFVPLSLSLRLSRLRPSGERTGVEFGIGFVTSVGKDLI